MNLSGSTQRKSLVSNNVRIFKLATIEEDLIHSDIELKAIEESPEFKCLLKIHTELSSEEPGCPIFFDSVLCWPKTLPGTWSVLPCFSEFQGLQYDTTQNATRFCHLNGTWDNYTNYDNCEHILHDAIFEAHLELTTFIYISGYILSLVSLILAVIIFIRLKDLRCLRNKIHLNLFVTFILTGLLWILTLVIQMFVRPEGSACIFLVICLHYFFLTNFFWMLVEGLYLYMLVVQTFSGDNLRLNLYAKIGWGSPTIFVGIWAIVKACMLPDLDVVYEPGTDLKCTWLEESIVDWIYIAPACLVLTINLIFLIRIMWVLITKLRSANTIETRQYLKASKALLVLIPLFGITYLIVLTGPEDPIGKYIFAVARAFLLSTQGFSVALFYCFLNSEVRQALKHRFNVWRDERNIRSGKPSKNRRSTVSKDYIRSRTESLRLTSSSPIP